jgi:hypothetical protein
MPYLCHRNANDGEIGAHIAQFEISSIDEKFSLFSKVVMHFISMEDSFFKICKSGNISPAKILRLFSDDVSAATVLIFHFLKAKAGLVGG